jgi:hypothetical protein
LVGFDASEADGARAFHQVRGEPYRDNVPVETIDTIQDEVTEFARCIQTGAKPETGGRKAWRWSRSSRRS